MFLITRSFEKQIFDRYWPEKSEKKEFLTRIFPFFGSKIAKIRSMAFLGPILELVILVCHKRVL